MKARVTTEYRNIVNRANVFQLTGNARDTRLTMTKNVNRIKRFYQQAVPELTARDLKAMPSLLIRFYNTANYYESQQGFSDFIVPSFSVIDNQEWLTVRQFIAFLQNRVISDKLSTVEKSVLNHLLLASQAIEHAYYDEHVHTTVSGKQFKRIMNEV